MKRNKLFLYSLTSLAVIASSAAFAEEMATAPTLEGGITASIGTFYVAPTAGNQDYAVAITSTDDFDTFVNQQVYEVTPDYEFGFMASLGYAFEDTANMVELFYRGFDSDDNNSSVEDFDNGVYAPVFNDVYDTAASSLSYQFNAVDLMFSQFLDIGTHVQVRFAAGASYLDLEKNQTDTYTFDTGTSTPGIDQVKNHSEFNGFGPRVGIDGRYDFGDDLEGFGIVAGGSLAYYVGDMDNTSTLSQTKCGIGPIPASAADADGCSVFTTNNTDDVDNHGVTNLRGNIGIDYVFFFDDADGATLGVELGYLIDYYADALSNLNYDVDGGVKVEAEVGTTSSRRVSTDPVGSDLYSFSYSGPYLNIKGVF